MKIITLMALVLLSTSVKAQQREDKIDTAFAKCLDSVENQSTVGMCECTHRAYLMWDKKLNLVYKELMSKLNIEQKGKLLASQRQWILFKEKEIEFINSTYGSFDGTMWLPIRAENILQITRERALNLDNCLGDIKEQ
jgi:uncharacterized protein YecT (DUF1311 family)